jgi:hypothetical protein
MRQPISALLTTFAFVLFAGCSSTANTTDAPQWAPMPLGEVGAARPAVRPVVTTAPFEIEQRWTDARGRHWSIAFRCRVESDDRHELLAAAAFTEHLVEAQGATLAICQTSDLDTIDGIAACEERLQARLTELFFPCLAEAPVARVSGIEWTSWVVR